MTNYKHCVIFILILINYSRCEFKHPIHKRVAELNSIRRQLNEETTNENIRKNFEVEDNVMYPRGDRRKLSKLHHRWLEYYACAARMLERVTTARQLPSVILIVYEGAVARLPCAVCLAPGERGALTWMFAKSIDKLNFTEIENHERMVIECNNLTLYNVMREDAGIYRCQVGDSGGGLVILEVVGGEETYTVVKSQYSRGPLAVPPEIYDGLVLFSLWSMWSECSVCGKVGRRHRYGLCYVKLDQVLITNKTNKSVETENQGNFTDLDNLIELFEAFPDGIPCRSQYLPHTLRQREAVQQRPSEIMIGMCKVNCKDMGYETKRAINASLTRTSISGLQTYALAQILPKQPALPARNIIFADFGQQIAIRCPGTTLRDVPVLWRVGTKCLVPRDVDKASGGRVHLNSRDHLVFTAVLYRDSNLYSCWQADNLAGTVKLVVWEGVHTHWNHHITLVIVVIIAAFVLRRVERGLRNIERRQSIQ